MSIPSAVWKQTSLFADDGWQELAICDASVRIWRGWLTAERARQLFDQFLHTLDWQQPVLTIRGQTHKIPRLQAWHGDPDAVYTYSGSTFIPAPWTPDLLALKHQLERACGSTFNSLLANCYRTGADRMGLHSDNERELGKQPVIASVSLGATRRFVLKPRQPTRGNPVVIEVANGDLLLMAGDTQHNWRHGIPQTRKQVDARINLTFRYICPGG